MNTSAINPKKDRNIVLKQPQNKTIEGVLVDAHLKQPDAPVDFNEVCDSLLISQQSQQTPIYEKKEKEQSFSIKKALFPLAIGTASVFIGAGILSIALKKSSKAILKTKSCEQLADLALNMNIRQEPQFATYRMLRDPNFKNIAGAAAVFLFSGLTLAAKNFVDGAKEIWVKKQEADIERDLQENLIEVETKVFSGKLQAVNNLLTNNVNYFKSVLNDDGDKKEKIPTFKKLFAFKGNSDNSSDLNKRKENNTLMFIGATLGLLAGSALLGKVTFANLKSTLKHANDFANNYTKATIDAVNKLSKNGNNEKNIAAIESLFQSISAKPDYIRNTLKKMGVSEHEINRIITSVQDSKKTLFADAPVALGGIPKKIQYYCYLDEDRGHLYNWVVNPENKFTKYIFLSFSAVTAVGYLIKEGFDALKKVAVSRENSKTELNLKKRLVEVEIENFKAKKNSAIQPLIDNFKYKLREKKEKSEMKKYAENVLFEIKNGPPYIYS